MAPPGPRSLSHNPACHFLRVIWLCFSHSTNPGSGCLPSREQGQGLACPRMNPHTGTVPSTRAVLTEPLWGGWEWCRGESPTSQVSFGTFASHYCDAIVPYNTHPLDGGRGRWDFCIHLFPMERLPSPFQGLNDEKLRPTGSQIKLVGKEVLSGPTGPSWSCDQQGPEAMVAAPQAIQATQAGGTLAFQQATVKPSFCRSVFQSKEGHARQNCQQKSPLSTCTLLLRKAVSQGGGGTATAPPQPGLSPMR
jgi:hypothetical protein